MKTVALFMFLLCSMACAPKNEAPPTQPRSELSNQYLECVMKEREKLYQSNTKKTDGEIIESVQKTCNSKILKIN